MSNELESRLAAVAELEGTNPKEAVRQYRDIAIGSLPNSSEGIRTKEQAVQKLTDLFVKLEDAQALRHLLSELRPLFGVIPKAKTAKIVRTIIDSISRVPNSTSLQVQLKQEPLGNAVSMDLEPMVALLIDF